MPCIKQDSTIEALAQEYCTNGRKQYDAMVTVGYTKAYANSYCGKMWENKRLIDAIARIDAKIVKKYDHNRQIAIDLLNQNIVWLRPKAENGDVQAISALTAAIRELNSISSLHGQTITNRQDTAQVKPEDKPVIDEACRTIKLKLA